MKNDNTVIVELLGEPLLFSKKGGYSVQVGRINEGAPTYMVTNLETDVQEYVSQTLPDAIRAADGIEEDLLSLQASRSNPAADQFAMVN